MYFRQKTQSPLSLTEKNVFISALMVPEAAHANFQKGKQLRILPRYYMHEAQPRSDCPDNPKLQ